MSKEEAFEAWVESQKEFIAITGMLREDSQDAFFAGWQAAKQRLHLTAIAACGLGVLIGLGIGWFWFGA